MTTTRTLNIDVQPNVLPPKKKPESAGALIAALVYLPLGYVGWGWAAQIAWNRYAVAAGAQSVDFVTAIGLVVLGSILAGSSSQSDKSIADLITFSVGMWIGTLAALGVLGWFA